MNTKTILGLSLAAVFAVSILGSAYAGNHLVFGANGITVENTGKSQSVEIEIAVNVPSPTGFDYGWAVDSSNGGFVIVTTHPNIGDDSIAQPPLDAYHTHFLTAEVSGPNCGTSPHATSATKNEVGRLSITGDTISVKNVPRGLAGDLAETGFSFKLAVTGGDLCINIVNTIP